MAFGKRKAMHSRPTPKKKKGSSRIKYPWLTKSVIKQHRDASWFRTRPLVKL